jgi:polygalacturonase
VVSDLRNIKVSRRRALLAIAGALGGVLARPRFGATVPFVTPPRWLSEAHDVIRSVRQPNIPKRVVTLKPTDGDTRALIQQAIDEVAGRGGGRVVLSEGAWRSNGPLLLRSGIDLHISQSAKLVFSGDRAHYLPPVHTRWEGTELYGYSPCIYAYKVSDVALTGSGFLGVDRNGDMEAWRSEQTEAQKQLRVMGASGVPLEQRIFSKGSFLRPSFAQFFGCERVLVEDVSIGSIPFWGVHLLYSEHCTVRGISVSSDRVNNDGVDIDSSRRVVVEHCTFKTGDDCIAIKSGRDLDGRTIGKPSEHVVVRDCKMNYSKSAGIAIGSEMSGGVRHVYLVRNSMGRVDTALNIKANLDRGGFVHHVRVWNLAVKECESAVRISTSYHGYMGGNFPPLFEDIEVDDLRCEHARQAIVIRGDRQSVIRQVKFRDVAVAHSEKGSDLQHLQDVTCERVVVGGESLQPRCSA